MLTERDVSIVRQTCIKAASDLVGNAVEFMDTDLRKTVLKNRESLANFVTGVANDFNSFINNGMEIAEPVDNVNIKVMHGSENSERCSTWPYREFLEELGLKWNADPKIRGYTGQLTRKQLEDLKNSDEEHEWEFGKDKKWKEKIKIGEIFTKLLKVEEE